MKQIVCILLSVFLLAGLVLGQSENQDSELQLKRNDLEKKSVEILDLKTALTIQENELSTLRSEVENIKSHNDNLLDSLGAKEEEIENLRNLLKAYEEEKTLSDDVLEIIEPQPEIQPDTTAQEIEEPQKDYSDAQYREIYNESLSAYFDKKYDECLMGFRKIINLDSGHPLADNAQYWIGECYYSREDYAGAIVEFSKTDGMGDGNKEDAALFKIGMSYLKIGNKNKAREIFLELEQNYPDSKLIEKTREYISKQEKF